MAYLQIKDFNKNFGKTEVLKGINIDVEKGEVVSIIGSSGSGKTTLLRCINFLETADKGEMILDGQTLFSAGAKRDGEKVLREKRLNFGLVFQSFNLFPQYTALKNITLAPTLMCAEKIKNKKKELRADKSLNFSSRRKLLGEYKANLKDSILKDGRELLEKTGLTDKADFYPCQLSGGQQQRVAIARALALKPKILCFDEPTSALDPELTGEVLKVIRSLKSDNRTMIIVTHEMAFAKNVSDKVIFMADGVVEEQGTPKQVFDSPKSQKLVAFLSNINNKDGEETKEQAND